MVNIVKNKKIIIILGVILVIFNVIYLYTRYQVTLQPSFSGDSLSNHPLFKAKIDQTVKDIQEKGLQLPEGSFALSGDAAEEVFEKFYDDAQDNDLFRMKVWNRNYTIIWANTPEIIGKTYPDNHEVEEGLSGEIEAEVEKGKTENFSERAFSNYAEVYIPVKDSNGDIVGVVETYTVTEDVVNQLKAEFYKSAIMSIGISILVLVFSYFGIKFFLK